MNDFHKNIKQNKLNDLRLKIIDLINKDKKFRLTIFSRENILYKLVGNELSMQTRINLSIQTLKDSSSLLPLHSDIWSGDSMFEVVIWIPLVDVYKTKSMYFYKEYKIEKIFQNILKFKQPIL